MRKHPLVIALSIAGIVAGTHAGIAAISNEGTVSAPAPQQTEPQAVTESQAPAEANPIAQVPAEMQTPADSTVQAAVPAATPLQTVANSADDEYHVRIPFTSRIVKVKVRTFPGNSQEFADPSPSVVAYFDRKNANTQLAGAPSPVFPGGSEEFAPPSPAVIAYFDQREARRLAAATPPATATPPDTVAVTTTSVAPTPGN
jgi:hypothetical protein